MSEVKRYAPAYVYSNPYSDEHAPGMEEDVGGDFVRYDDYAALRSQLTTAERERDEARRERDEFGEQNKRDEDVIEYWRHRAERAERVVEAAREWNSAYEHWMQSESDDMASVPRIMLAQAVRALDAAERPNA